jgi:formylglycine-generating enzyme required for sulfatase activity
MDYRKFALRISAALVLVFLNCTTAQQAPHNTQPSPASKPPLPPPTQASAPFIAPPPQEEPPPPPVQNLPHEPRSMPQEKPTLAIALSSDDFANDAKHAASLLLEDERILHAFAPLVVDEAEGEARFMLSGRIQNHDGLRVLYITLLDTAAQTQLASLHRDYHDTADIAALMPAITEQIAYAYRHFSSGASEAESGGGSLEAQEAAPGFVWVDAGTYYTEQPVYTNGKRGRRLTVAQGFYVGKTEVTQEEWHDLMGMNPSGFKGALLPVENVTWFDAVDYCNARSRKEGLTPAYTRYGKSGVVWNQDADGYRLPTEAEWELAARGGVQGGRYRYSGGDRIDEVAWYSANSGNTSHPVGSKEANELGLFDMSGNVWEWCWDWYEERRPALPSEPPSGVQNAQRVLRGGSWSTGESYLSTGYRNHSAAEDRYSSIGFRVLRGGKPAHASLFQREAQVLR